MPKALKIIAISIYAVCGGLLALSAIPQVGFKALSVATGSMTPAIPQGSLVIIHRTPLSTIKVGEVVTYRDPAKAGQTITHRVVAETTKDGIPMFTTKGDANKVADPQVAGGSIVGEVIYHAAGAGRVVSWLHSLFGIILIIAIPALIIITSEFELMIRRLQQYAREEVEQRMAARQQQVRPVRLRRKPRPLIWVIALLFLLPALTLGVQATRSQLSASARLTDTTIATAATTPPSATGSCPSGTTSVSITNTGPGSTNTVNSSVTCVFTSSTNSSVTTSSSSSQTATSGSVTNSDNTTGGSATSGSASNSSSSTTNVTIKN